MIVLDGKTPWQPEWAARAVDLHLTSAGFTTATYGTSRWLARDPYGERLVWWRNNSTGFGGAAIVEGLTAQAASRYASLDLQLSDQPNQANGQPILTAAWALMERVPRLAQTIAVLVQSIHILDTPSPGYDVSHSDPELPCSIFLSLPIGEPFGSLRTAESVIHEAMHLQLTLFEAETPLVEPDCAVTGFSPWQQRDRPLLGLVHGLFVFAAIDRFMALLIETGLNSSMQNFAIKRRREVAAEIKEVPNLGASAGLTIAGRQLVVALLDSFNV